MSPSGVLVVFGVGIILLGGCHIMSPSDSLARSMNGQSTFRERFSDGSFNQRHGCRVSNHRCHEGITSLSGSATLGVEVVVGATVIGIVDRNRAHCLYEVPEAQTSIELIEIVLMPGAIVDH